MLVYQGMHRIERDLHHSWLDLRGPLRSHCWPELLVVRELLSSCSDAAIVILGRYCLYAVKRGERPLIRTLSGVCHSTLECSRTLIEFPTREKGTQRCPRSVMRHPDEEDAPGDEDWQLPESSFSPVSLPLLRSGRTRDIAAVRRRQKPTCHRAPAGWATSPPPSASPVSPRSSPRRSTQAFVSPPRSYK